MSAAHDTQALAEKLGFVIDPPGTACRGIRWPDGGARPASVAEEVMWDALASRLQEQEGQPALSDAQIAQAAKNRGLCTIIKDAGYRADALWFDGQLFDFARDIATLAAGSQAVQVPGWRMLPVEPTEEMHAAAVRTIIRCGGNADFPPRVWRAMLNAAPLQHLAGGEVGNG